MNIIVDFGWEILNTYINHDIYGNIGDNIKSRKDVGKFVDKTKYKKLIHLLELIKCIYFHTICAEDEKILDEICFELKEIGYLI